VATLQLERAAAQTAEARDRSLFAACLPVSALDDTVVQDMYALYATYYAATSPALFRRDLEAKNFSFLLRDRDGILVGFSTLAIVEHFGPAGRFRAIYSGDTIIHHAYWGTQALAFNWIRFAGSLKAQAADDPLYWFLIVKGHRTYRYLSAFSVDFFPRWNAQTPSSAQLIMDTLAYGRFGQAYDASRGVVSFAESRGHLKPRWAVVESDELRRRDVAFFLARNPGYDRGDELVCLTELAPHNLRPIARRIFEQGLRS
jgi:hypothetical protein